MDSRSSYHNDSNNTYVVRSSQGTDERMRMYSLGAWCPDSCPSSRHSFRRHHMFAIIEQLVVERSPGKLPPAALLSDTSPSLQVSVRTNGPRWPQIVDQNVITAAKSHQPLSQVFSSWARYSTSPMMNFMRERFFPSDQSG